MIIGIQLSCDSCMLVITVFFFNDTATTEIYTLSLHDALPICARLVVDRVCGRADPRHHDPRCGPERRAQQRQLGPDRKSTRLNSSHGYISYAVFCLKKKKNTENRSFNQIESIYTVHMYIGFTS